MRNDHRAMTPEQAMMALERLRNECIISFVGRIEDYEAFDFAINAIIKARDKHSAWYKTNEGYRCARCGSFAISGVTSNWCPHCGARMDGDAE